MGRMNCLRRGARVGLLAALASIFPAASPAQVDYVARFRPDQQSYLLGEPIFCVFTLENTGTRTLAFSYRLPSRVLNRELEQEPRFSVQDEKGRPLADPAPKPCGGVKGSVVYGYVTLPPGRTHSERWLVNQWARLASPGRYRLRAERRLPLYLEAPGADAHQRPVAYALAINELDFEVKPATESDLEAAFAPYRKALDGGTSADFAEAALVVTTLPHLFLLPRLETLASARSPEGGVARSQALEGLARLGTRQAWQAIAAVARGPAPDRRPGSSSRPPDDSVRAYAVLLLGEKADPAFLPTLAELVSNGPEELRGGALRALGFFHDARANQTLFERLHAPSSGDRVNAILGLKNLESRDAVPALMAMLNDPAPEVRQVAHFALGSLTGAKLNLAPNASTAEAARVAQEWHAWWRGHEASFVPAPQPACQDW